MGFTSPKWKLAQIKLKPIPGDSDFINQLHFEELFLESPEHVVKYFILRIKRADQTSGKPGTE
jgi:hypothetical protein